MKVFKECYKHLECKELQALLVTAFGLVNLCGVELALVTSMSAAINEQTLAATVTSSDVSFCHPNVVTSVHECLRNSFGGWITKGMFDIIKLRKIP
jgi:hypothetical protein